MATVVSPYSPKPSLQSPCHLYLSSSGLPCASILLVAPPVLLSGQPTPSTDRCISLFFQMIPDASAILSHCTGATYHYFLLMRMDLNLVIYFCSLSVISFNLCIDLSSSVGIYWKSSSQLNVSFSFMRFTTSICACIIIIIPSIRVFENT